jgi:transmembrane sensor
MTRAHDPLSRTADTIEQEAAEWLVKVEQDGAPETSRALAAWLAAHPRHRAAFLRISTAWRRADVLKRLADPNEEPDPDLLAPERPPATESITEPVVQAALAALRPPRSSVSTPSHGLRFAMAAALLVAIVGAFALFSDRLGSMETYATAVGEFRRVTLPDGSVVALNTDTQLRVSFSSSRRKVELIRGEAKFEVVHDETKPFVVAAGETAVFDVGTAFVVRLRDPKSVDVLVEEGRVVINPPSENFVSADEMALVRGNTIQRRAVDDIRRRTAWTEHMLIFSGETLSEAVAEFNRYNRRHIVITDAAMSRQTIGGAFNPNSPERFATAVEKMFGARVQVTEGTSGSSEIRLSRGTH